MSMVQISRAILLGCTRKCVSVLNTGSRAPVANLQYFADIVEEVERSAIPESCSGPLCAKVARMEQKWLQVYPATP